MVSSVRLSGCGLRIRLQVEADPKSAQKSLQCQDHDRIFWFFGDMLCLIQSENMYVLITIFARGNVRCLGVSCPNRYPPQKKMGSCFWQAHSRHGILRQYPMNLAPFEKSCEPLIKELLSQRSIPLPENIQEAMKKALPRWLFQKHFSVVIYVIHKRFACNYSCCVLRALADYLAAWEALYKNLLRVLAFSATAALQSSKVDLFGISIDPNFRRWGVHYGHKGDSSAAGRNQDFQVTWGDLWEDQ